ncbi:Type 1 glutamine amidotransferase-like domain-containing protein [Patescibacteria group bacterium]|nr:Type 1 glutamine amidotransferase-like domain-containing protein [Patescibacteria group bacterium]
MPNLFLTSNAYMTLNLLLPYLPKNPSQMKVAFVPTASHPEPDPSYMQLDIDAIQAAGFIYQELDIKDKDQKSLKKVFEDIDIVFVAGGNTFYLLQEARQSGFDEVVTEFVNKGGWYIGSSAGSVLAAPDIAVIKYLDDPQDAPQLTSTNGLGLIDLLVLPHWGKAKYKQQYLQLINDAYEQEVKYIALLDTQALLVQKESYRIIQIEDKTAVAVATYEKIAQTYTEKYGQDLSDSPEIDSFLAKLPSNAAVLDVGAGPGQFSNYIHQQGFTVTGIDFSIEMNKIAQSLYPQLNFQVMDMRKLQFEKESFDGVLVAYSLIHIQSVELRNTLKGFLTVLKPGGYLLIIAQAGEADRIIDEPFLPSEKMFFNFFTPERLQKYLSNVGFEVESIEERNSLDPDSVSNRVIYALARRPR